jgi:hypothetical protein|nr:MAG TPA: YopX protein [Caudoviricetes sp.]
MIPRYRAWYVLAEEMINEILMISFVRKEIIGKFRNGSTSVPLKFEDKRNGEDVILMQSTGLKDKNGQEIFEGDILEIQGIKMIVKFGSYEYIESSKSNGHTLGVVYDGLGFYVDCINAADPDRISPFEPKTLKESTIIGNRFENRELLEDKK